MNKQVNIENILARTKVLSKAYLDKNCIVLENNEPLVKIKTIVPGIDEQMSKIRYKWTVSQSMDTAMYARETVCWMLNEVTQNIAPAYSLVIFDAWRPTLYQKMRFDARCEKLRLKYPDWTEQAICDEAFNAVAPPDPDPLKAAPHLTGGAIDLTLKNIKTGELLDMGTNYGDFDKPGTYTNSTEISKTARANRTLLATTMAEVGFSNFPAEWWHFMFGEREWAAYEKKPFAIYGGIELVTKQ